MSGDGPRTDPWRSAAAFIRAFSDFAGWRGLVAAALVGLAALIDGISVVVLIPILGVVIPGAGDNPWRRWITGTLTSLGATTPLAQLAVLLAAFVVVAVLRAATLFTRDMALGRLQAAFVEELRNQTLRTLSAAPWSSIVSLRHARVTNLLGTEMQRVSGIAQVMIQGSVAAVLLVVQSVLAFALAPKFAAVALLVLAVGGVFLLKSHGRARDIGGDVVRHSQAMMGSASGFLGGLKAAAAQNGQGHFVGEYAALQRLLRERTLTFQRRQSAARVSFGIGSAIGGAAVVFGGVAAGVSPPVLIALILIFARMSGPAQQIQQSSQSFFFSLPSFEGVQQLDRELMRNADPVPAPIAPRPGPVALHHASFLHPGGGGVKLADLAIEPGTFVGISGPSGAGKTTLIDMLIGLLVPQSGTMSIGGEPVDAARRAGWRDGIAYVPQDGFLFHDTVRRNITWGDTAADAAAIDRALRLAGADALVARLEHGLETVIGERGAMLSGGERQRIALARALIRQPRLLVLDEAANAIDAAGEAALLTRLAALDPRPTILMISHRAESMALCDRVISVEAGVVSG